MDGHHAVMHEIELKFQVPRTRRAAVDAAVAGRDPAPRQRLQAAYFDTADRALARAGMALRIRREGRHWVQTLKAGGDDGLTRAEHNVPLAGEPAAADPQRHAGTPVGERLAQLLADAAPGPLACLFRTDIRRRSRQLRTRQGVVELAFDEGTISAGDRRWPVCELEIELVSGSPLAVIETGRRWVLRHGLWLDTRSKAERGDLLARGETMAPVRKAQPVELAPTMSTGQALQCVLRACLDPISVNASQVADGRCDPEHVHQLRVGLRRLRTALSLFEAEAAMPELAEHASVLFRRLGAARDRVAVAEPLERDLQAALRSAGLDIDAPGLPALDAESEPSVLLRLGPAQMLLLDLLACTQSALPPAADEPPLRKVLTRRLSRWDRTLRAGVRRLNELDDTARHDLRKRAKRLRYGIEFAQRLFKGRDVRRMLKPLGKLQDRLGEVVDSAVAMQAYRDGANGDARVLFALGWLAARKQGLMEQSGRVVKRYLETKRAWKG
ncbi:MAG TPA: CHAD domain-containing protein [Albitalea sp.]|nr:CHAD domain-containing protein [Albitalea sp.]